MRPCIFLIKRQQINNIFPYLAVTEPLYFNMQRINEPELMNDKAQAEAYAAADFEQSDKLIIEAFDLHFPGTQIKDSILDLGCGPGNISFQVAKRFPDCHVIAIDGSTEMIRLANERRLRERLQDQISFIKGIIPDTIIPQTHYSAIVSNSLLHHLQHPDVLWSTVKQHASPNTKVLIIDLFRPQSEKDALSIVKRYSGDEPEILQHDFYHSLLAAFTTEEIELQLVCAGMADLKVKTITDRHVLIVGEITI